MRPRHAPRNRATGVASLLVVGVALTALFLGFEWFWVVFVVGFAVVVPLVATLTGEVDVLFDSAGRDDVRDDDHASDDTPDADDPLSTLRRRYADGELTDEQFERKLELLLETETVEDVAERARRGRRTPADEADTDTDADADAARER